MRPLDQHYEMTTRFGAGSLGSFRVDAVSAEHNAIRPCKPLYNVRKGNINQIRFGTRSYTTFDVGHRDKRYLAILDLERRFGATYLATRMLKLLLLTADKSSG